MFNLIVIILKSSLVLSDKSNLIEHTWVRLIELGKLASVELVQIPFEGKKLLKRDQSMQDSVTTVVELYVFG